MLLRCNGVHVYRVVNNVTPTPLECTTTAAYNNQRGIQFYIDIPIIYILK